MADSRNSEPAKTGNPTYIRDAADPSGQMYIDHGGGRREPVERRESVIERAARAVRDALPCEQCALPLGGEETIARAVLAAIREPSEAVMMAGMAKADETSHGVAVGPIWSAMIDAALEEG